MSELVSQLLERVQQLEHRETIRDALVGIARGTDRFDSALLASLIHEDAELDMGGKTMTGAAFAAALKPPAVSRPGRMHMITNLRIELDGDQANTESHILSCQDVEVDGIRKTRMRAGRYVDRFERRDGVWKIAKRVLVDEWSRIDTVEEAIAIIGESGRPKPDDYSYRN
jgi:hypothetical protein